METSDAKKAEARTELLLRMYDQMFNDINRHIMVVWQSVGVLVGAFAIFALAEKQVIGTEIASTLILLIAGWSLAHHLDAGYWYNRNLVMIANIERQFLLNNDLKEIHYYFGAHRPNNKMITHLRIQVFLALGIAAVVLVFHTTQQVMPGIGGSWSTFNILATLPYIATFVAIVYLWRLRRNRNESYQEFIKNSPGRAVSTAGIEYGVGHGHDGSNATHISKPVAAQQADEADVE